MNDVFHRFRRTKMILSSLLLVATGIILLAVGRGVEAPDGWTSWIPWSELGSLLVGAGVLGIWLDAYLQREQDAIDELRLQRLLDDHTPAFVDATIRSFAANHEDLKRVATPEFLDQLISNSLALRLGDEQFAAEIYTDIRDQAIRAAERWHNASLSVELAPFPTGKGSGPARAPSSASEEQFTVTVRWEYTTVPKHAQRRFVCVSDRDEYDELGREKDSTSAWYINPANGIDASTQAAFELLRFTIDGDERPIRRSERKTAQTYTASIPAEVLTAQQPVTIAYTYRTLMNQSGHVLFFDVEQPTRDLRIDFDYTNCAIATVSTLDLVPSVRPTRIEHSPHSLPGLELTRDLGHGLV